MAEHSATEAVNELTRQLDQLSVLDMLRVMNDEDGKVAHAIRRSLPDIARLVDAFVETVQGGGAVIFVGAGTSGRLGLMEAAECSPTFGVPSHMIRAIIAGGASAREKAQENSEDDESAGATDIRKAGIQAGDLVIGLSASGATPYVLAALREAKAIGATTGAIVCNHTELESSVDVVVTAIVGPEVVSGSTRMKAGTAQKMILNMLTTASMVRLGRVYGNLMVDLRPVNKKLKSRAVRIIVEATGVDVPAATEALQRANGVPKVAILSLIAGIPSEDAQALLLQSDGRIHEALAQVGSDDHGPSASV